MTAVAEAEIEFVRRYTRVGAPPFVPEVRLHLSEQAFELWERTEAVLGVNVAPPPFWAFAWAGGQALARYLLDHPDLVRDADVLDLAAGSGLVAIAAARAGAHRVTAVDIDRYALAAIGLNAGLNGVAVTGRMADVLDGDLGVALGSPTGTRRRVVLAGDVCYSREMTCRVLRFLHGAADEGAFVLLGDPGRAYLPRAELVEVARYDVPVPRELEDSDVKLTTVWRLPAGPPVEISRPQADDQPKA